METEKTRRGRDSEPRAHDLTVAEYENRHLSDSTGLGTNSVETEKKVLSRRKRKRGTRFCPTCNSFEGEYEWDSHCKGRNHNKRLALLRAEWDNGVAIRCDLCDVEFNTELDLMKHIAFDYGHIAKESGHLPQSELPRQRSQRLRRLTPAALASYEDQNWSTDDEKPFLPASPAGEKELAAEILSERFNAFTAANAARSQEPISSILPGVYSYSGQKCEADISATVIFKDLPPPSPSSTNCFE